MQLWIPVSKNQLRIRKWFWISYLVRIRSIISGTWEHWWMYTRFLRFYGFWCGQWMENICVIFSSSFSIASKYFFVISWHDASFFVNKLWIWFILLFLSLILLYSFVFTTKKFSLLFSVLENTSSSFNDSFSLLSCLKAFIRL